MNRLPTASVAAGESKAMELENMIQDLFGCFEKYSRVDRGGIEDVQMDDEPGVTWSSLLKQAQANLAQARANEETSRAMHLLTQRMSSKGAFEIAPDRLESWYAAECDAGDGVTIAEKIAKQAEGLLDPGSGEGHGGISSPFNKTAVGTKRAPSVLELLVAGGKSKDERYPVVTGKAAVASAAAEAGTKQSDFELDQKAIDEGNRHKRPGVAGGEGSKGSKPGMIAGSRAPAKSSHLTNVVEFEQEASDGVNRHECSDVAGEEGSRGSKLGMIVGSRAPAIPLHLIDGDGVSGGSKFGMIVGSQGGMLVANPKKGDVPQASELPRPPEVPERPDGLQGVTVVAAEASELPRPPETQQRPDGLQGTALEAEPTSAAGVPAGYIGTRGAAEKKKVGTQEAAACKAAAVKVAAKKATAAKVAAEEAAAAEADLKRQREQLAKRIVALEAERWEAHSEASKNSLDGRPGESASETLRAFADTGKGKDRRGAGARAPSA